MTTFTTKWINGLPASERLPIEKEEDVYKKFAVMLCENGKVELAAQFDTVEEAVENLTTVRLQEWIDKKAFIIENLPLRIELAFPQD